MASPASRHRWTLPLSCLSVIVLGLDNTILNVALPTLAAPPVEAGTGQLQWIVDAYVLVFACLLLLGGACGDRFGHRTALMTGMAVFGVGSALASAATGPDTLIAARAVMGAGAAFVLPTTLAMLVDAHTDPGARARAIAVWSGASGLGVALGPAVGGLLLEWFWWGSVFLVNVPIALLVLVLAPVVVPQRADRTRPGADWAGAVLSAGAFSALVYAIVEAPVRGWFDPLVLGAFGGAAVALVLFVMRERRAAHPMLDVRMFGDRGFAVSTGIIALAFFAVFGCLFPLTLHLQFGQGHSALEAGLRLLPVAVALMAATPLAVRLSRRLGARGTVAAGMAVLTAGVVVLAVSANGGTGYGLVLCSILLMGFGTGLVLPPATGLVVGGLRGSETGVGSAVNQAVRQIGVALGVAVLGSVTAVGYRNRVADALVRWEHTEALPDGAADVVRGQISGALTVAEGLPDPRAAQELTELARLAFREAVAQSALVAAGAAACGVLLSLVLLPRVRAGAAQAPTPSSRPGAPPRTTDGWPPRG